MLDAVFLDRDGTVNAESADYVKDVEELIRLAGALDALASLATFTVPIVLITNQSAIGRGIVPRKRVDAIHEHLQALVAAAGGASMRSISVPITRISGAPAASPSRGCCTPPPI
jgi:D-glycero-D-manno-heptose 1,7-bisphosphate phosphatase